MHIRRFYKPVGEEGEEEDKALVLKQLLEVRYPLSRRSTS